MYTQRIDVFEGLMQNKQQQNNVEMRTVLPAKSDSDAMFCFQSYQGLIIDRSLVYKSYPQM